MDCLEGVESIGALSVSRDYSGNAVHVGALPVIRRQGIVVKVGILRVTYRSDGKPDTVGALRVQYGYDGKMSYVGTLTVRYQASHY